MARSLAHTGRWPSAPHVFRVVTPDGTEFEVEGCDVYGFWPSVDRARRLRRWLTCGARSPYHATVPEPVRDLRRVLRRLGVRIRSCVLEVLQYAPAGWAAPGGYQVVMTVSLASRSSAA